MTRPNIIFIVADDLGYADLGCYGGREADFGPVSPVLDSLAKGGLRLTQGYANSPVCSPTRFALATARYQYRLRGAAEEPINSKTRGTPLGEKLGLPPEKVVTTVDLHANTSAASVPLALSVAVADGRIKQGDLVMLEAMGGGFTWGASLIRW